MQPNKDSALLGQLIRNARLEHGLSIRNLEGLTGIYRGTLSHVEKGAHVPAPETLALLSTVLDIPLADLYQAAGYPIPDRPPSLRPYLRGNFGLPEDALDDVERYLELVTKAYANSPLSADHGEPTST